MDWIYTYHHRFAVSSKRILDIQIPIAYCYIVLIHDMYVKLNTSI